jgi:O-antigen ligase
MLYLFLTASLIVLPLLYLTSTLDPVMPLRTVVLAVIDVVMAVYLLIGLRNREMREHYSILYRRIFLAVTLYVAVTALTVLVAINKSEAVVELLYVMLAAIFLTEASVILVRIRDSRTVLLRFVTLIAFILSIIALFQYYGLGFTFIPGNFIPYATMANKNLLTAFLAVSLPFALLGWLRHRGWWYGLSVTSTLASFLVIMLSQTRSAWVALLVCAVALSATSPWWLKRFRRMVSDSRVLKPRLIAIIVSLGALVVLSATGIVSHPGSKSMTSRAISIAEPTDESVHERLVLWGKSLELFSDHPWTGVGPGNWKIDFPALGTGGTRAARGDLFFQRPHNDYLWVLTESGVFGLLFYMAIFLLAGYYLVQVIRGSPSEDRFLNALVTLAALLIFMAVSFFSYPRERIALVVLSMLVVANGISLYHRESSPVKRVSIPVTALFLYIALIASVVAGLVAAKRLQAEVHITRMMAAREIGDWKQVVTECDAAHSIWMTLDPTGTPLLWYRGVAEFSSDHQGEGCDDFSRAYSDNPNHPHVLNNLGTCYELRGEHEQAIGFYKRAVAVAPRFDDAYLNLAAVYFNQGRYQEAHDAIMHVDPSCQDPKYQIFLERIQSKLNAGQN